MKYKSFLQKSYCTLILVLLFAATNAQLATYPFRSSGITPQPGTGNPFPSSTGLTSANVTAQKITVGNSMTSATAGSFNSGGLRIKTNSLTWPTAPTDGFHMDVILSPKANYDFTLTGIQFKDTIHENTVDFLAQVAYQIDGLGSWHFIGTSTNINTTNTIINFGTLNQGFYDGHIYTFRIYFYANGSATTITDKNNAFRINFLTFNGTAKTPPAINPTVHLTGVSGTGFYSTNASGTYDIGAAFRIVNAAGFLCGTNATPTFTNAAPTYISTLGSPMNATINGLTPGVSYYIRAFAITQTDTILANIGEIIFVKTSDPQEPLINTLPPIMASVVKATTGGWAIDSAGSAVIEKGILYSTNSIMTYPATTHTSDGKGNADFYTKISNLLPNTKYYVMAYARNALGVGYGNLDSITTGPPAPYITAVPGTLDFGDVTYNSAPTVLSYKVNANYLNPSGGTISLNATNGYTICGTYNGTYNSTLSLPYSAGTITNKIIYVKTKTNAYGIANGMITHSGGSVVAPNADTVFLSTNVIQNQDTLSNMGTDFWAGFGCQEKMSQNTVWSDTTSSAAGAHLTLYIAAGSQAANVIVEMPGIAGANTFPRVLNIPANTVGIVNGFPIPANDPKNNSGAADSRLYYTGVSSRGIHIYSTNGSPVACWLYDWATNNSAAGSMLFPTNSWNSSYSVLAYGGDKSNTGDPSSYFFVIASQDSTTVKFTPTADIIDSASSPIITGNQGGTILYAKGTTYSVLLKKKGDVFNALGFINSGTGISQDLTGTKISTTCDKKIAVFGGNSRTLITTSSCGNVNSGSDNLIQQMFPSVAWGTKYLTVPTKTMEYNLFRVAVTDPTTKVWVDNVLYTTASPRWNATGSFYAIEGNQPRLVTSDKPISVTQFILPGSYCGGASVGNNGTGDPEMILLSPIQQAITKATVYCPDFKDNPPSGGTYINVIIPKAGIDSFKLDNKIYSSTVDTGSSSFTGAVYGSSAAILLKNAFVKHPLDTNYYYAKLKVSYPAPHTLSSNVAFNAIAYGTAKGESWGYNAGTAINNLSAVNVSINPGGTDTSSSSVKTVKNNLVYLQIAVPYDTTTITSVIWDGQGNTNVNPNTPQNGIINPNTSKPICLGTIVKDGRTFYIYQSPVQYTFLDDGAYKIKVTFNGTFVSDCGGFDVKYINVIVGHDDITFDASRAPTGDCTSLQIKLTDNSTGFANTTIKTWIWDFGDGSKKDTVNITDSWAPNPKVNPHTYPTNTIYYLKLTTINSIGGVTTDSIKVDLSLITAPIFTISKDSTCPSIAVVFTPLTTNGADKWFWDYGDGSAIDSTTTQTPVSHSYTAEGIQTVSHWIKNSAGCPSSVTKDTVFVFHKPIADFILPSGVCLPGNTLFTNTSDTATGLSSMSYTYHWDFGVLDSTSDTSNVKNPTYKYTRPPAAGEYNVSLVATSKYGCISSAKTQMITNVYAKPTAIVANTSSKKVCAGSTANFFDGSTAIGQTINSWYWNFGDGAGTSASQNPNYSGYTNNLLYTVKLAIGTDKGCVSDTALWSIKVNPKPVAGTILPSSCITSGSLFFQDNSTVATDDSVQTPYIWTWNFGDGTGTFTTKDSTHTYSAIGTYYINHSITTLNGCTDNKKDTFVISGSKPVPKYSIPDIGGLNLKQYCSNQTVYLRDSSTIAIGTIKKVEIYWDTSATSFPGANLNTNPTIDNSPQNGVGVVTTKVYSFNYPVVAFNKSPVIKIVTYNDNNCFSVTYITNLTLYGTPKAIFDTIKGICLNGSPKLINLAHDSSGKFDNIAVAFKPVYTGTGVVNDTFFPATAGIGTHLIKVLYETKIPLFNHCKDSAYAPITVWDLPQPIIQVGSPACEKNKVTFTDKTPVVAGTGGISSWKWHFGEPSSLSNDSSTLQNPTHTYSAYGSYNVFLTATSDSGCVGTNSVATIATIHPLPKVGFISPNGTCAGSPVTFTDTSKIADGSQSQFNYVWNFGDPLSTSNTASGTGSATSSHQYNAPPTDSVRLIITSKDGCIDSMVTKLSSTIYPKQFVKLSANGKNYNANDTIRVCLGNTINFKNTNSPVATLSYWDFGNPTGTVVTGNTTSHIYTNAQVYTGQHYALDNNNCNTDTVSFKVQIWALPTVAFDTALIKCEKANVAFIDKSVAGAGSGNISSWTWHFGDGGNDSSKLQNPSHIYNNYGSYNVSLKVTTDSGCSATLTPAKTIVINPKPKANFVMQDTTCLPLATTFTSSSTIADGSESQFVYLWNFGDIASGINNASIANPASHSYPSSANYTIQLIVASKNGCIDTTHKTLLAASIHNQPNALYSVNTISHDTPRVCVGVPINFKDASSNVKASYWVWGDNGLTIELGTNPAPQFATTPAGIYYGQHYIDDNFGCRSTLTPIVTIIDALPTIKGETKYVMKNTPNILTPTSTNATTYLWTVTSPLGLGDDYLDFNDVDKPICTPLTDITYLITASNDGGCSDTASYYVKLLKTPEIPTAFSPNGDGINDTWNIGNLSEYVGASVQVFNRYGQMVLNKFGYSSPWNGKVNNTGADLPIGVYYYIIKPGSGMPLMTGYVTILR